MKTSMHRFRPILAAALILSLVIAAAWSTFRWRYQQECEDLRAQAQSDVSLLSRSLMAPTEKFKHLPGLVANHASVLDVLLLKGDAMRVEHANTFLKALNSSTRSEVIYVMDTQGLVLASSNWDEAQSFVGQNYAYRPYFQDALKNTTGRFYGIGVSTLRPGYYSSHVVTLDGRVLGVAVVKIDLSHLDEDWGKIKWKFAVTDENGIAFLSSRPDWKYRPITSLTQAVVEKLKSTRQYGDMLKESLQIETVKVLSKDDRILRIATPAPGGKMGEAEQFVTHASRLADTQWSLQVFVPTDMAYGDALTSATITAGLIGLAMLAALCLRQYIIARRLRRESHLILEQGQREIATMKEEMRNQLVSDSLTGAYSQRFFLEVAGRLACGAKRHSRPFSLLAISPDHFRQIRQAHGETAGDEALAALAALCKRTLRGQDIIARAGEEDFAVAMPDTDATAAAVAAERVRSVIEAQKLQLGIHSVVSITVSIGITQYLGGQDNIEEMISRADAALYAAKNGGRNQVSVR